jgi:predicted GNAT superfamily acetyltransferase
VLNLTAEANLWLGERRSALMLFSESAEAFVLDLLIVPTQERGRGIGSTMLRRLLALADAGKKPVLTIARPVGQNTPETLERLVKFYESFGFRTVGRGVASVTMRRVASPRSGPE